MTRDSFPRNRHIPVPSHASIAATSIMPSCNQQHPATCGGGGAQRESSDSAVMAPAYLSVPDRWVALGL